MTIRLPRVMKSVLAVGAIAGTLTAVALSSAGAADPRGQTQAGAATDPAAQADQTPGNASAGEAIELSIEQAIATLKEQGYSDITEINGKRGRRQGLRSRPPRRHEDPDGRTR